MADEKKTCLNCNSLENDGEVSCGEGCVDFQDRFQAGQAITKECGKWEVKA